jgi:hypothetical protein
LEIIQIDLSKEQQKEIVDEFNKRLNKFREETNSLFLPNYRNSTKLMSRKRISFDFAYDLISNIINDLYLGVKK